MGLLDSIRDRFIVRPVAEKIVSTLREDIAKRGTASDSVNDVQRFTQPFGMNDQMFQKRRDKSAVTYSQLRNMARYHEISRACINIRKHQITQLDWGIVPVDPSSDTKKYKDDIAAITAFFRTIGGYNTKLRKVHDMIVEDFLVIDGIALANRRTYDGRFLGIVPIDSTTIKLRVTDTGGTPQPPDIAYEQWINGSMVAELTADQMTYDMLNPSTETAYGYSVMEALVLTVEQSLRAGMFNLAYFSEGTVPEGIFGVPKEWTKDQISQYQDFFDSLLGGDPRMQRKLKFVPSGGDGYTPTKPFDFSQMQPFLDWLMHVTATLFGVMPQELGFTDKVNRSNGQQQGATSQQNSIRPLANAIADLWTDYIQKERFALTNEKGQVIGEMGPFPDLKWKFLGLDEKDALSDSEVTKNLIGVGAMSVDEWRKNNGLEPLGLGPYVMTAGGPILVTDVIAGNIPGKQVQPDGTTPTETKPAQSDSSPASTTQQQQAGNTTPEEEIKRWEKKALNDFKEGRSFRKFESQVLDEYTRIHLSHDLEQCVDREEIKKTFDHWRTALAEGITRDAERLLYKLADTR